MIRVVTDSLDTPAPPRPALWPFGKGLRGSRGQAIVEFTLAIPLLLVVVCGILEFSFVFADQIMLNNAARDGVRAAAIPAGDSNANRSARANTYATNTASSLISCPTPTYTPTFINGNPMNPGVATQIRETVQCTYHPITPLGSLVAYLGGSANTNVGLTGQSTKMIEP